MAEGAAKELAAPGTVRAVITIEAEARHGPEATVRVDFDPPADVAAPTIVNHLAASALAAIVDAAAANTGLSIGMAADDVADEVKHATA